MLMTDQEIIQLFRKFDAGDEAARDAFVAWSSQCTLAEFTRLLQLAFPEEAQSRLQPASQERWLQLQQALTAAEEKEAAEEYAVVRRLQHTRRWIAAASVLLLLAAGAWFWLKPASKQEIAVVQKTQDIQPGKDGAVLTLSNGTRVVLDSLGNGIITTQNGANVVLKNGQLAYELNGTENSTPVYNTISTPKGRQFQLLLPDGTKVYLNAATTLKYPTLFSGKERRVQIDGEAYFEVAKDPSMPFRVNVNDAAEVEVLGTHFNISAYKNESSFNTTLIEGSVRISRGVTTALLKPGQQALVDPAEAAPAQIPVRNADVDKVIAWRKGIFDFNDMGLHEMMRQIERWYDIEVVYEGNVPDVKFFGKTSRSFSLSNVLEALEGFGLHYRMEGRKLIVIP
jgi:transmembrane sensor